MEHSPLGSAQQDPDPHDDIFRRSDEENSLRYRSGHSETGGPIEEVEFPPNERTLLDDDFLNQYGRDPDEQI